MRRESKSDTRAIEQHIVELKNKEQNTVTGMLVLIVAFVGICLYFVLGDSKSSSRNEISDKTQVNMPKENTLKDKNAKPVNRAEEQK
ncbi:MAG: hypothetical protein RLZZ292_1375 [Bacteroidota bacterium]|jgi:hypothetical protein